MNATDRMNETEPYREPPLATLCYYPQAPDTCILQNSNVDTVSNIKFLCKSVPRVMIVHWCQSSAKIKDW